MKYLLLFSLVAYLQVSCADVKPKSMIKSSNLNIYASTYNGNPVLKSDNWLRFYQHEDNTIENRIYITAEFNVENAIAIVVADINAENKLCGENQKKFLLYLAFEPNVNLKKITTRIHKPCFVRNKAVLKLNVKTQDGHRYYNITELKAHPDAFNPVSE